MQKKITAVLMATCLCALAQSQGQFLQPKAKGKTLVRLPEQGGHWTVLYRPHVAKRQGANGAAVQPASAPTGITLNSIEVVSTGYARRDRLHWTDGKTTDVWRVKSKWFVTNQYNEVMDMDMYRGTQLYPGWNKFENSELQNIAKSGTGTMTVYKNMPVLYYGASIVTGHTETFLTTLNSNLISNLDSLLAAGKPAEAPKVTQKQTQTLLGLFVDPETLFPVAYTEPSADYFFGDIVEGPQSLSVPPEIAFIAKKGEDYSYTPTPPNHP